MVSYSAVRTVYPVPARLRSRSNRSTDYPADNRANRATHHSAGYSARADTNGRIALSTGNVREQRESEERREADQSISHQVPPSRSPLQRDPVRRVPG